MYREQLPTEFPSNLPQLCHCYDAKGKFLHIFKPLPGITLSVLHQHLDEFLCNWSMPEFPYQIAQHPEHPFGFVITVHRTHIVAITVAEEEFELRSARPQGVQLSYLEASETHGILEEELYDLRQDHNLVPPASSSEALQMAGKKASSKAGTTHPSKEGEEFSLVPVATNIQHMMNQLWLLTPPSSGATPSIEIVTSRLNGMFHWICLLPYAV
jgi:hypothetical protein